MLNPGRRHYEVDDVARVGTALVDIEVEGEEQDDATDSAGQPSPEAQHKHPELRPAHTHSAKLLTTPAVRRLIKENGLNIRQITGSGKDGRVLKEDVLRFLNLVETEVGGHEQPAPTPPRRAPVSSWNFDYSCF